MVASIKVKVDMSRVDDLFKRYPKKAPVILNRGINNTMDTARVMAVREISADTKLAKSAIFKKGTGSRRPIKQTKATRKNYTAVLSVTGKRFPLILFKARQLKMGVSYDLGRGRSKIKSAFITEVFGKDEGAKERQRLGIGGHTGVFKRVGQRPEKPRGKMIELFGPSLPGVFVGKKNIIKKTAKLAKKNLSKNIDTQIKLALENKA